METIAIILIVGVAVFYIVRRIYNSVKGKTGRHPSSTEICSSCKSAATCDRAFTDVAKKLEKDKKESSQPENKTSEI